MFILGALSILQMICLPGLLTDVVFRLPWRGVARWVSIFGISLLLNYLLVILLVLLHIYTQTTLIVVLAIELAALGWLYRKVLRAPLEQTASKISHRLAMLQMADVRKKFPNDTLKLLEYTVFLALLIFALTDLFWLFKNFVYNIATVFNAWDALLSYNQWALSWAQGRIPAATNFYPQLLPVNWSFAYLLLNKVEIQFFPKFIMPLFSFLILLMLFDLGVKTRDFGFFIAVILTRLVIKKFTGNYIGDGTMELPTAFFGFGSIYLLLLARREAQHGAFDTRRLIVSGALAAAAALTKQAGLFSLVLFPLLAYLLVLRSESSITAKAKLRLLANITGGLFLTALSWYLYKYITILQGVDSANIEYVTSTIYGGMGYIERALSALSQMGKYAMLLAAVLPALLLVKPAYRWVGIVLVIPYTLTWLFFFSYATRNLALIFPLWMLILGLALRQLFDGVLAVAARLRVEKTPAAVFPLLFGLLLVVGAVIFPAQRLIALEEERRWQILDPQLNEKIRVMTSETGADISVLSRYPIGLLPGLRDAQIPFQYDNLPDFLQSLKDPNLDYLLAPIPVNDDIEHALQDGLENGRLELLFTSEGAYPNRMFRILH